MPTIKKLNKHFFHQIKKQFFLFALVGTLATLTQYSVLIFLVEAFSIKAVYASSVGYVFGAIVNYCLNRRHTFQSNKAHYKALMQFTTVFFVGFGLNALLMEILTISFHFHYFPAQILVTGLLLFVNFAAHRQWTFRDKVKQKDESAEEVDSISP